MWWVVVMGVQAGPPDTRPKPRTPAVATRCPEVTTDEIVVCGARDQEAFRLRPLPQGFQRDSRLPPAQVTIGGVGVSAEAEAGQAIGGAPPRAMVRLKIPL